MATLRNKIAPNTPASRQAQLNGSRSMVRFLRQLAAGKLPKKSWRLPLKGRLVGSKLPKKKPPPE